MSHFARIEGDSAVVRRKGGFRQVDLYTYKGQLFFKFGPDYYRINDGNGTSHPDVYVDELPSNIQTKVGPLGRLEVVKVK